MAILYFSPIYQNFVDPVIFRLCISIIGRIIFYLSKTNSCSSCRTLFIYPFNSLIIAHGDIISISYSISYLFLVEIHILFNSILISALFRHVLISMRRLVLYLYSAFVPLCSSFHYNNLCIRMCIACYLF
jgi:hypothetical protein